MRMRDLRFDMVTKKGGASCIEVARTLQRYLDGGLDEPTRSRIAAHLAVCRRCGLDEQAYREILTALSRQSDTADNEPIERLPRVRREPHRRRSTRHQRRRVITATQPVVESARDRWTRRRVTIPIMLGVAVAAFAGAPILIPGAAAWDVIRLRLRLPTLRTYLFVVPVRFQRHRRDPRCGTAVDTRRMRYDAAPARVTTTPSAAAGLVDPRPRPPGRAAARAPGRGRGRHRHDPHAGPCDRDLPPRQPLRRLTPLPALRTPRVSHSRRDHGRAPRRSWVRPSLPTCWFGIHPTRQRPRRHHDRRIDLHGAGRTDRGRGLSRGTTLPA